MPQENQPITHAPKVEDESTGNGSDRHGKHREGDDALSGKGSSKGGLNRGGDGGATQGGGGGAPIPEEKSRESGKTDLDQA